MGFIAVKCPGCGADIQLDDSREYGYCTYCGQQVVREKIIVEHRVKGTVSEQSLIERAYLFIGQRDFDQAKTYLEKALDINPKNGKAYLGKLFCQMKVTSIEETKESDKPLEKFENYHLSLKFLPDNIKAQLEDINKITLQRYEKKREELSQRIGYEQISLSKIQKANNLFGSIDWTCKILVGIMGVVFLAFFANGDNKNAMMSIFGVILCLIIKGLVYKKAKDAKESLLPQEFLIGNLENQLRDLDRETDSLE